MFKKKEVKPEFVMALDNTPARDYDVYVMKPLEKMLYFLGAFVIGAAVAYLFYGGLCRNSYGEPTKTTYFLDALICGGVGVGFAVFFINARTKTLVEKRRATLRRQFRELLDTLTSSLGSGKSVHDSFINAYTDMSVIYSEDDYIMQELMIIKRGLANSIVIEDLLLDFGKRSGIDDIVSFASVFATCNRRGGNVKDIIRSVQKILTEKMSVEEQIATLLSSSEMEQNIMILMPMIIIAIIKFSDSDSASKYATASGIAATTIGVACFVAAYIIGKVVTKIKV